MTPLDILTIIGAIGCYSYTAFLWKSDESHLEKVLKKNTLTCIILHMLYIENALRLQ